MVKSKHVLGIILVVAALGASLLAARATPAAAQAAKGGITALPPAFRPWYANAGVPTGPSPYAGFKPKHGPPWVIGYASTYSGNTWRASVLDQIQKEIARYKAAGLVSKLIVTENKFDVGQTIQQMKQLRDQGADAILTIAPSATGINQAIADSAKAGVPVVNFTSPVTTPFALNTGVNYYQAGWAQAKVFADQLGDKGTIIYVHGIPGFAASEQMKEGSLAYYKQKTKIEVAAVVNGIWTNSIAKAELLKTLATNTGTISGIHQQSGMAGGAIAALEQAGRANVPVLVADDVPGAYYWKTHPSFAKLGTSEFPARSEAKVAVDVLMRTLERQGPKIASIVRPPQTFSLASLSRLLPAGASLDSEDWLETIPASFYKKTLPQFFTRPSDPLKYRGKK